MYLNQQQNDLHHNLPHNLSLRLSKNGYDVPDLTDFQIRQLVDKDPYYQKVVSYIPNLCGTVEYSFDLASFDHSDLINKVSDWLPIFIEAQIEADMYSHSHVILNLEPLDQPIKGLFDELNIINFKEKLKFDGYYYYNKHETIHHTKVINFVSRSRGKSLVNKFHKYWSLYWYALLSASSLISRKDFAVLVREGLDEDLQLNENPDDYLKSILEGAYQTIEKEGVLLLDSSYTKAEIVSRDLANIEPIIKQLKGAAIGASLLPEQVLFGYADRGVGLGSVDLRERTEIASNVDTLINNWKPKLELLLKLHGYRNFELNFKPSLKLSLVEQGEIYKMFAEADKLYYDMGVLTKDEIRTRLTNGWSVNLTF
jgi:hypothetical protein